MNKIDNQLAIAEKYLDEMLEAESSNDYKSWIKHFEKIDLVNFNEDIFARDIQ